MRMLGACTIVAAVVIAAMVASASAKLPEWGKCEASPTHEGKYADSGCIEPVKKVYGKYTGGYEWTSLVEATEYGNGAELLYGRGIEQSPVSFTLASGYQITCSNGLRGETALPLREERLATAPDLIFTGCANSEGGSCLSAGFEEGKISEEFAYEKGNRREPGSWTGEPEFIEGKRGATPTVGIVYKTEEPRGRFFEEIACEGEAVHAFVIGGEKRGEELTTEIKPVNTMTDDYTAVMAQSNSVQLPAALEGHPTKPLEAFVNGQRWETVGIQATMVFPELDVELPNPRGLHEVELKATP